MYLALSAALACSLSSCASGSAAVQVQDAPDAAPSPTEDPVILGSMLDETLMSLEETLSAGPNADCARACELLEVVCGLSEEICRIADEYPDPDTMAQCESGRGRCLESRAEVDSACGVCSQSDPE